jgi:predicted permease
MSKRLLRGEVKLPMRMLAGWRMDLTLAVRMLIRHPALSGIAVFGITVAIAIAATIFTILGEQLDPGELPLPEGHRIVAFQKWDSARNQAEPLVPADVVTWREQLSTVREVGAFRTTTKNLMASPAAPELIEIAEMSAVGFDVAGIAPRMGRYLRPEDERAGAPPVVVIGHAEWRGRFSGDEKVLNTTVQLGDAHYTVVGVMPEGFAFPIDHAYWIPLRLDATGDPGGGGPPLSVFGRLAPGSTLQNAQAELAAAGDRARNASPSTSRDLRPRVVRYANQFAEMESPDNRMAMQLLRFFVTILLVVVSVNIAALVYARTAARQAEIAVRTALGASRGRIVAQLCGEGLVLAGLGALAGVGFTAVALDQLREAFTLEGGPMPFWLHLQLSWQTIGYVVAFTAAVAGIIGALPAWKATGPRIHSGLQALSAGGGGMQLGRAWTAIIVLQVAFAAGLLPAVVVRMSELAREGMAGYGFAADEFLVAQLSMEQGAGAQPPGVAPGNRFAKRYREMEERIAAGGTVRGTTFSSFAPGFEASARIQSDIGATETVALANRVAVNFFGTYGVPILTGRYFTAADASPEARSVVINRSFAQVVARGASVLGSRIRLASGDQGAQATTGLADDWYQVVGIVEDFPAPTSGTTKPEPKVYRAVTPDAMEALTIALRLQPADRESWGARLRHVAAGLDPLLQVRNVSFMGDLLRQQQRYVRLLAGVVAALTLSVLLLSAAGIYAMMAFSVTRRRREIGIRLALGASARRILWTMFSRAAAQLLAGAGLGTVVAVLLDRAAGGLTMSGQSAVATAAVVLLITLAGLLAALGPARQGLRIQPTEALRDLSH